jgi:hypothetical protein
MRAISLSSLGTCSLRCPFSRNRHELDRHEFIPTSRGWSVNGSPCQGSPCLDHMRAKIANMMPATQAPATLTLIVGSGLGDGCYRRWHGDSWTARPRHLGVLPRQAVAIQQSQCRMGRLEPMRQSANTTHFAGGTTLPEETYTSDCVANSGTRPRATSMPLVRFSVVTFFGLVVRLVL